MKGISPEQYVEILKFVQDHCRFGYIPKSKYINAPQMIKYVDCTYDSRFGDIWIITFRGSNVTLATNHFNSLNPLPKDWKYENLYDWVMAYLKGEWEASKEFIKEDI